LFWIALGVQASDLDVIGLTLLRRFDASLKGTGIAVAQPEAPTTYGGNDCQVNPSTVGQAQGLFTWISSSGATSTTFPNGIGSESAHADTVAGNFYGVPNGVATNVSHVYNYEANYFINLLIGPAPASIVARVVNQSFTFGATNSTVDQALDNYAFNHNAVIVSGAPGGPIYSPASCFNGVAVGIYNNPYTALGPTEDGRCKPDLVAPDDAQAPGGAVSYATAYVSGAAVLLLQAAARNDGGAGTAGVATNLTVLKALLLNGAVKPADWTNGPGRPMDARHGAGVLNVYNSWKQLKGGRQSRVQVTTNAPGAAHLPGTNIINEPSLTGWDYGSITNSGSGSAMKEVVNHYYFNLSASNAGPFTLTATMVWNRQAGQLRVNNLNLFLVNAANSNIVAVSTGAVDNVRHLFVPAVAAGRYDLQVQKTTNSLVSAVENYGLAFEFFTQPLGMATAGTNLIFSWPAYPAGFTLMGALDLAPPAGWSPVVPSPMVDTNTGLNLSTVPVGEGVRFFRLQRP